jgi:hypothetical protein
MSDSRKQTLGILARISEFLEALPEDQVAELESGDARLTIIPAGSLEPLRPAPKTRATARQSKSAAVDVHAIAEAVRTAETRESATATLRPLRKDPDLKEVAVLLNVTGLGNLAKDKLIDAVVEATVGSRLDSLAIRGTATLPY